jgi:hypothetical protein
VMRAHGWSSTRRAGTGMRERSGSRRRQSAVLATLAQALEQNARKRVCGHGAARRAGLNVQVELWCGGLAWASTRTARPRA